MGDQSLDDALAETLEHQTFEFEKNSQSAARSRMGLPHAWEQFEHLDQREHSCPCNKA